MYLIIYVAVRLITAVYEVGRIWNLFCSRTEYFPCSCFSRTSVSDENLRVRPSVCRNEVGNSMTMGVIVTPIVIDIPTVLSSNLVRIFIVVYSYCYSYLYYYFCSY
jgi:hypothetical protein